ncbi:hypothetical protein [Mangrovibrevibacter kandeliae]|uniref:hypothetical protein n=1 Tax=Mangrovibrevibacter kandeliae TaxID=2968473 RepID=UPI00211835B2|nr:hypothetical protein [Aurantimonas sp. CSK15Z-1]MCQ8782918.1 hypothetical protein [Aurantimonas sp. CSK15Z-1]
MLPLVFLNPERLSTPFWWLRHSAVQPSFLLPLIGCGLASRRLRALPLLAAACLFAAGLTAGLFGGTAWDRVFAGIPAAFEQRFYSAPIATIAIGAALVAPGRIRPLVLPPASFCVGAAIGLCVMLTNPTLGIRLVPITGILFSLWLIAGVTLSVRGMDARWPDVAIRIFGSWMIAIGVLYGGASLFKKPTRLELAPPTTYAPVLPGIGFDDAPAKTKPRHHFGPSGETSAE